MTARFLWLGLSLWGASASAQFPLLQPDSAAERHCPEAVAEARLLLEQGEADRAIALCTACLDSVGDQWAHYIRARALLVKADTLGYCMDMTRTWALPEARKLEFSAICTAKDSGGIAQFNLNPVRYPGVATVAKTFMRTDGNQIFRLYDQRDARVATFVVIGQDTLYTVCEAPGEFKGGMERLGPWLKKTIRYPQLSNDAGIQGTVHVRFIVDEQGKVESPKIIWSPAGDLSEEVLRVMALMPRWKPARAFGRVVRSMYTQPVSFRLQ